MVQRLIFRHNLSQGRPIWTNNVQRNDGAEWTLHEAAARLGINRHTAYQWIRQGRLPGIGAKITLDSTDRYDSKG